MDGILQALCIMTGARRFLNNLQLTTVVLVKYDFLGNH